MMLLSLKPDAGARKRTIGLFRLSKSLFKKEVIIKFQDKRVADIVNVKGQDFITVHSPDKQDTPVAMEINEYIEILNQLKDRTLKCAREDEEAGNKHWEHRDEK